MKQTIKTGVAALLLLLALSCKKESSTIQSFSITDKSLTSNDITDTNAPGKIASVTIGNQVWMKKI